MLTVYSTQGSPGASTTAMHLAAHWASTGREVLLIEADPAGGTLSHNLGIQFTPGSASFVASGLPVLSNHLIDHAQDVLFESLHVMPAPASPTGARGIFHTFADFFEDLRTISENEIAVIIDGGRITADTAASGLTTGAAGVVVVCRNNSQLSSLEHLKDVLAASPDDDGPQGCVVTIGNSPMDPEEWPESHGLTFCGSIEIVADMATDLSAYLGRKKRRSKKWWTSLEQVGERLYQYAQPPASDQPRRTKPPAQAPPPITGPDEDAGPVAVDVVAAASEPLAAEDPAPYGQAPPTAPQEPMPAYGQAPPTAPAPGPDYGYPHDLPPNAEPEPGYGQPHYVPPTGWPGTSEGYDQPPPPYPPQQYPAPPHEQPQPGTHEPYPPQQYPAPPHEQPQPGTHEPYPPQQYPAPPHEQPQPGTHEPYPPQQYPAPPHEQPQPGTHEPYPPQQYPAPPHEQPQPGTHEPYPPQQYPAPPHEQPQPGTHEPYPPQQYPAPPHEQPQPGTHEPYPPQQYPVPPYEQPPARPEHPTPAPPEAEFPPRPNMEPTGSFREWAVKLHGPNAGDAPAQKRGG